MLELSKIAQLSCYSVVNERIVNSSILVDQDIPESLHSSRGFFHLYREQPRLRELFKEIIFLSGKTETESRDPQITNVNHALNGNL